MDDAAVQATVQQRPKYAILAFVEQIRQVDPARYEALKQVPIVVQLRLPGMYKDGKTSGYTAIWGDRVVREETPLKGTVLEELIRADARAVEQEGIRVFVREGRRHGRPIIRAYSY